MQIPQPAILIYSVSPLERVVGKIVPLAASGIPEIHKFWAHIHLAFDVDIHLMSLVYDPSQKLTRN